MTKIVDNPAGSYQLNLNIETIEQGVKYLQS